MLTSFARGQAREEPRNRIVERQLVLFRKKECRGGGDLLAVRCDLETHGGRGGQFGIDPRISICLRVSNLAVFDNRNRCSGNVGFSENPVDDFVD